MRSREREEDDMQAAHTVTVKLLKGERAVPAVRVEGGLALHRDVDRPGFWTISHAPSGHYVWSRCARNRDDAMVRFDALLAITDWDRPRHELVEERGWYQKLLDLKENPPSAPRKVREPRPPLRIAKRVNGRGEEFETPVWWEEGGLTVEGPERFTITHEASGLRVVTLPRKVSRAKAVRLAKTFLDLGREHGMDWTQKNPFPPSGAPPEIRRLVSEAEQGNF